METVPCEYKKKENLLTSRFAVELRSSTIHDIDYVITRPAWDVVLPAADKSMYNIN